MSLSRGLLPDELVIWLLRSGPCFGVYEIIGAVLICSQYRRNHEMTCDMLIRER